ALKVSRRAMTVARQNLTLALASNAGLIAVAMFGVASPALVVTGTAASALLVLGNAARLLRDSASRARDERHAGGMSSDIGSRAAGGPALKRGMSGSR
ncbi:MAG: hypothetical protein ACRECQ_11760, partial [Burkholderiaceae bacterium]